MFFSFISFCILLILLRKFNKGRNETLRSMLHLTGEVDDDQRLDQRDISLAV
jgi:hypothetical protein